jgi:hypothetical protein
VNFTAFLASNLIAQFSRQIVVQILGLESPKVCGNLAVYVHSTQCIKIRLTGTISIYVNNRQSLSTAAPDARSRLALERKSKHSEARALFSSASRLWAGLPGSSCISCELLYVYLYSTASLFTFL